MVPMESVGASLPHTFMPRGRCDFCNVLQAYTFLRTCHECSEQFCIPCAPPLSVAVLQCCNFHGLVVWFCSESCRSLHTSESVRNLFTPEGECID